MQATNPWQRHRGTKQEDAYRVLGFDPAEHRAGAMRASTHSTVKCSGQQPQAVKGKGRSEVGSCLLFRTRWLSRTRVHCAGHVAANRSPATRQSPARNRFTYDRNIRDRRQGNPFDLLCPLLNSVRQRGRGGCLQGQRG